MAKTLKIAFALGGGVSLGAFAGGAMSETLKLVLLNAAHAELNPQRQITYDRVVVDVFSGASAGAMSLGLMLRSLSYRTPEEEGQALETLRSEADRTGLSSQQLEELEKRNTTLYKELLAVQVLQNLQKEAWVKRIDIVNMLPDEDYLDKLPVEHRQTLRKHVEEVLQARSRRRPNNNEINRHMKECHAALGRKASLFDRGAVDDVAALLFHLWQDGDVELQPRVLADRVLFAATLVNLNPMVLDARKAFGGEEDLARVALRGGLRSTTYRDMRVFDVNFNTRSTDDTWPENWYRLEKDSNSSGDPRHHNLRHRNEWAVIASTCVASGAVPFAFEPVPLLRYKEEYTDCWPYDGIDRNINEAVFPFVDGGTFNNEPIREAFRLASFIDSQTDADPESFERLVVFVDLSASPEKQDISFPVYDRWKSKIKEKNLSDPEVEIKPGKPFRLASLDRLFAYAPTFGKLLWNETRVVEEFRNSGRTLDMIAQRDKIWDVVCQSTFGVPDEDFAEVAQDLKDHFDRMAESDLRRRGLRTSGNCVRELQWTRRERRRKHPDAFQQLTAAKIAEMASQHAHQIPQNFREDWLKLLLCGYLSSAMALTIKSRDAKLLAIAPYDNFNKIADDIEPDPMDLLGDELGAFAGFLDERFAEADELAGRYCAAEFLSRAKFKDAAGELIPLFPEGLPFSINVDFLKKEKSRLKSSIDDERRRLGRNSRPDLGVEAMRSRVKRLFRELEMPILNIPLIDGGIKRLVGPWAANKIQLNNLFERGLHFKEFDVRVIVPDSEWIFYKKGIGFNRTEGVVGSSPGRGEFWLETTLQVRFTRNGLRVNADPDWSGYFVDNRQLHLRRGSLKASMTVPPNELLETVLLTGGTGFQASLPRQGEAPVWSALRLEQLDVELIRKGT